MDVNYPAHLKYLLDNEAIIKKKYAGSWVAVVDKVEAGGDPTYLVVASTPSELASKLDKEEGKLKKGEKLTIYPLTNSQNLSY